MSNAELIAEARRGADYLDAWDSHRENGTPKPKIEDYGLDPRRMIQSHLRDLAAALESQPEQTQPQPSANSDWELKLPEQTANVEGDREVLVELVRLRGEAYVNEIDANTIADAILAAGFSRAQGEATVEWGVIYTTSWSLSVAGKIGWQTTVSQKGELTFCTFAKNRSDAIEKWAADMHGNGHLLRVESRIRTSTVTPWKEVAADE